MTRSGADALYWVVGGGGLLGGAILDEALRAGHGVHRSQVSWQDPAAARAQLRHDAQRLAASHDDVALLWCAGAGVVATSAAALDAEIALLRDVVTDLVAVCGEHPGWRLRVFLASSAGGVYAGSDHPPFSESTPARAISPYGEAKLAAEAAVRPLADHGVSVFIGRIANLYGPGQDITKPQGIITQLCRAQLQRSPLSIYVPLDVARDYLFVRDAARMALGGLRLLAREPAGTVVVKILATQATVTLASIIGELRRITKRRPPIVLGMSPNARFQARDLRFHSQVWPELDALATTPLPVGVAATLADVSRSLRTARPSR